MYAIWWIFIAVNGPKLNASSSHLVTLNSNNTHLWDGCETSQRKLQSSGVQTHAHAKEETERSAGEGQRPSRPLKINWILLGCSKRSTYVGITKVYPWVNIEGRVGRWVLGGAKRGKWLELMFYSPWHDFDNLSNTYAIFNLLTNSIIYKSDD